MALSLPSRSALLISECQRGILDPAFGAFAGLAEQAGSRGIVPRIAVLAAAFRTAGMPVFHLTVAHRPDFADVKANSLLSALARKHGTVLAGSPQAQVVGELAPAPQDFVVERSSGLVGFLGTSLDAILRRMEIGSVVIAGVSTNVAVTGCAIVAADLGYHVVVAEDCTAASDAATHQVIVRDQLRMVARVSGSIEIAAALRASG
jgi:nicotinamidase-related amidase